MKLKNRNNGYKIIFVCILLICFLLTLFSMQSNNEKDNFNIEKNINKNDIVVLEDGIHSTNLIDLKIAGYDIGTFSSGNYDYNITLSINETKLKVTATTEDPEASYVVNGNENILNDSGTVTVTVTEPHSFPTVYNIHYTRSSVSSFTKTFNYTGAYQEFEVPIAGEYKIEVWGARAGGSHLNGELGTAGKGGYSTGTLKLTKGQKLYVYVGGQGSWCGGKPCTIAGGWNGGGQGIKYTNSGSDPAASGGGATDVRLVSGTWNLSEGLNSRFIVAGGGGGGGMDGEAGGHGGGTNGINGNGGGAGTQTSGFGFGQGCIAQSSNGSNGTYGGPGGGGGWYGGYCSSWYGSGGGSGFIYTKDTKKNTPKTYTVPDEYFLSNANTIAGNASMPNPNGGTMVGNAGNGVAKFTLLNLTNTNNYLKELRVSSGNLSPQFNPTTFTYNVTLDKYTSNINIDGESYEETTIVTGLGNYEVEVGETKNIKIIATAQSGDINIYSINVTRNKLNPGEHSSKLIKAVVTDLNGQEFRLDPKFSSDIYNYVVEIPSSKVSLNIGTLLYDDESKVKITGNEFLGRNSVITITVTNPYVAPTTYKINVIKEIPLDDPVFGFDYTGDYQEFTAPQSGLYQLEVWGAQGSGSHQNSELGVAGKGGYSRGSIYLYKGETVYVYVGGQGNFCYGSACTVPGGWNGGGQGVKFTGGYGDPAASGGGATDIRIVSGEWNLPEGLNSRFIVAGGGGGGGMDGETAGSGGGINGIAGYGAAGTATSGFKFGQGCMASTANGSSTGYGGPGGGGGWYGGYCNWWYGSGGGSGFILTPDYIKNVPYEYNVPEKYYLQDAITIAGNASMPSKNGGTTTGNEGNGYARITKIEDLSENNYLENITTDRGDISPTFDPTIYDYDIFIDKYMSNITIDAIASDYNSLIVGTGTYEVEIGETKDIPIFVTSTNGETRTYTVHVTRKKLNPGEHSTKLAVLKIENNKFELSPEFHSETYDYTMEIPATIMSLKVETLLFDDESSVTVTGNGYIKLKQNGLITITVTSPYVSSTTYKVKVIREGVSEQDTFDFDYKGEYQEFIAPMSGLYKLETWGAQGGGRHQNSELGTGGNGGYSSGIIYLAKGQKLYIYVGGKGSWCGGSACTIAGGWNGGGQGIKYTNTNWDPAASGGGATDIRTVPGEWNSEIGLNSRIIVAGGGGGGGMDGEWAGAGGGLEGVAAYSYGGTQTTGFKFGQGCMAQYANGSNGTYGGPGGGGGWYGGGCRSWYGSGGGSGFVLTEKSIENTPSTYKLGKDYYLKDAETISGNQTLPSKNGGYSVGNTGNGFARITKVEDPSENNFLQSITLRYEGEEKTYSPTFDASIEEYIAEFETTETEVAITAKPEDSKSTIDGLGKFEVLAGTNIYPITVTAENGDIKVYQVKVHRNADTNPYPDNIEINGLVPSLCSISDEYCKIKNSYGVEMTHYDKNTHTYYLTVPSRIKQLYILVDKGHPYQTMNGEGKLTLEDGTETYTVTVSAENIDEIENPVENVNYTVYNFVVTKDMSGDNDLEELEILDPERDINFNPDVLEYYLSVPNNYTTFQVNSEKEVTGEIDSEDTTKTYPLQLYIKTDDDQASMIVTDPYEFNVGMNQINIMVTARNGEIKVYVLNVYREQNENVFLKYITVTDNDGNNYELTPEFNKINTGEYIVTVPNNITNVKIDAQPEYNKTTVTGIGNKELLTTKTNNYKLITTSESGIVETYSLAIIREKNSNSYLSNIEVINDSTNYLLTPVFDKETLSYEVDVEEDVSSIEIKGTPEVSTTQVRLLDNSYIKVGTNIKRVMSIAEDGTNIIYTIKINRPSSSNNYLSSLSLMNGNENIDYYKESDNSIGFEKEITEYKTTVPNNISSLTVNATKDNNLSSLTGTGRHSLKVGENTITLTVTSESGVEKQYVIHITREPNSNNYLKSITTSEGVIVPTFDKEKNNYSIDVENDIEDIVIIGTPEVNTSTVDGNGTYKLESGNNIITLTVKAEDGTTKDYIVNVYRDKSENDNISYLLMKEGAISPIFDPNVIYYEVNVPNEVTKGNFIIELEDKKASYVINGSDNFEVGENNVVITVTSESGLTKDYTVVVNRQDKESASNYLMNIYSSEGTLIPTYNKTTQYYEVEVPYETTIITLGGQKEDSSQYVTGLGTYTLNVGRNLAVVKVTSADGYTRDYQIVMIRKKNTDARLSSITINGSILSPNFNKDVYEYTTTTTETSLDFTKITTYDPNATYEILNNKLTTGVESIVTIRVTAQDGITTKDYNIKVEKNASNNNNLSNLEVENYNINPTFNKITTLYSLTVPNDVNNINIIATAEDPQASINGAGVVNLKAGENQLIIEVMSESGKKKAYTIVVTREASNNNLIDQLTIQNGLIDSEFIPTKNIYNVTVPNDITSLEMIVKLQDPYATYKIENNKLESDNTVVSIIVTAQDGTTNNYTLKVRKKNIVIALLKKIDIKDYKLTPTFNSYVNTYNLNVDNEINNLDLNIETIDKDATYVVTGNKDFKVGLNVITIEVTASDNITKEIYTINVNKQQYSNNFLDYLYSDQGDLKPVFEKYTMDYTIDVSNTVTEIELFGEAVDKSTTVTGLGTHTLSIGSNVIPISLTSKSGITRTYYVTVNRALNDDNTLMSLNAKVGSTKYELAPDFDPEIKTYNITVPAGTKTITLSGEVPSTATVSGLGTIAIEPGTNTLEVVVTSESGIDNKYTIIVTRPLSDNAELTDLVPSVGTLEPLFAYGVTNYVLNLDSGSATLAFEYSVEDLNAKVEGYESRVIPDGASIIEIVVTAENGTKKTYTITINKERTDNAKLSDLYIKGYDFTNTFDPDTNTYYVTVPNEKKVIRPTDVIAIPQDNNSKINKSTELSLSTTTQNEFTITVTAPDGFTKQDYKIYITREKGSNVTVTNIIPKFGFFEETFKSDRTDYTWKVPKGTTEILASDVTVLVDDDSASILKTSEVDMSSYDKTFEVTVTSEDGTNTMIYNLYIEYEYSANAYLSSLNVDKGYYLPEFKEDIFEYDVYVYDDVDEVTLTATLSSNNSTLIGDGLVTLTDEVTTREIIVTAEDGTTETYVIRINKTLKTDPGLKDLFLNGLDIEISEDDDDYLDKKCTGDRCILNPSFNTDVISYDIKVPYEYTLLDVLAVPMNEQQTVKIKVNDVYVNEYELPLGDTKVLVEVYDIMNKLTRTYTLNIKREQSNNTYLKSLEVDGFILEEEFNKHVQEYTVYVGKNIDSVDILAEPEEETSKINLNGYNYLDDGENDATIEVVAKDGTTRTYILHIIKSSMYNNKIKMITVSTGVFWDLTPKFKPTTTTYTTTVPGIYDKVTVEASPVDPTTIIVGTGEYPIVTGNNEIKLFSTSPEDGETIVYTINVIKQENTNVDLKTLIVEEGTLTPVFDKGITSYSVTVQSGINKLNIHAIPDDPSSTIKITGNDNLVAGENKVNIIVTSEDKSASKTYQLLVNKLPSDNNYLNSITITNELDEEYVYTPSFNKETDTYYLKVPYDVESVNINATSEDKGATIKGIGKEYLNYGVNNKNIAVTSESGLVKVYSINIYRNYDLRLKDIVSSEGDLTPEFDPNVKEYQIDVPNDINEVTLVALKYSNKVSVTGSGTYNLLTGPNEITFVVSTPEDDENINVYTVIINRAKDDNNYIKELSVDGIMTPVFNKETQEYTVDVRKNVRSLNDINYKLDSKTSTAVVLNNESFLKDNNPNKVIIRVTSESGKTRDYTLNVMLRDDDYFSNRLASLTIDNGSLTPDFAPDINNYAVTVSHSVSEINIEGIAENERAIVTGDGLIKLNVGRNVIPIKVTSQDKQENIYNVIIYRNENNDATLQNLIIKGQNYIPIFNKIIENYSMEIGSEFNSLDIIATPTDNDSTVKIIGNNNLHTGENIIRIVVTAPDKITTKTYTITVNKQVSKNNYLSELNVSGYEFTNPFIKTNQGPYVVNVPSGVNSIVVNATPEVDTTTIYGDGVNTLVPGKNVISVNATSESGDTKTYTIIVNKALSTDSTLKDILLSDESLIPEFNSGIYEYTINVPEELESITVTGIANDSSAKVEGNGTYDVYEDFDINIVVTAEDGNKTTYKINIHRDIPASSYLKQLIVKDGELYPGFHKLITSYTILVPNEIRSLNMVYLPEDENANVTVTGNENFKVGTNKVHIIVTATDGTSTDYEIAVVRQTVASNYLKSLSVDGYSLTPIFDKTNMYYETTVPLEVDNIKIKATAEDPTSTITGTGYVSVKPGLNKYYVTVESASGVIRTYQIVVNRAKSDDNYLLTLESDVGELLPEFNKEIHEYTINVPDKTTQITLNGTVSANSKVNGLGTSDVPLGETTRTITVTSQSGEINTYTVKIKRGASKNTELDDLVPSNGTLEPAYTNDITEYTMDLDDNINIINFIANPTDKDAKVTTDDIMVLNYGENTYHVNVLAEDGVTERNITIKITRKKDIQKIEASTHKVYLEIGETKDIKYIITPNDTTYPTATWSSKDTTIATIDQDGRIKGIGYGSTTIQITSDHDSTIYDTVTVMVMSKKILSDDYVIVRNELDTPEEDKVLEHIIGLEPKMTIKEFISKIKNEETMLKVYDMDDNLLSDTDYIGTGCKVKLVFEDTVLDELTIIVRGDLNGDGDITTADYVKMKNYILKKVNFNEKEMLAGDLTQSSSIGTTDYVKLKNYILKKIPSVN